MLIPEEIWEEQKNNERIQQLKAAVLEKNAPKEWHDELARRRRIKPRRVDLMLCEALEPLVELAKEKIGRDLWDGGWDPDYVRDDAGLTVGEFQQLFCAACWVTGFVDVLVKHNMHYWRSNG